MKKILKLNKTLIVLGIIAIISLISFIGLYKKENGVWKTQLKDYILGNEIKGYRELHFILDTIEEEKEVYVDDNGKILGYVADGTDSQDTSISLVEEDGENFAEEQTDNSEYKKETRTIKANEDEAKTIENFNLSKQIIQNRLKSLNNLEYNIRVDNVTGEIVLEVPDDEENTSTSQALVTSKGLFDIIDYQTGISLLDNSDLQEVKTVVNYEEEGYQLYLQIFLNKSGKEKISDISQKYVEKTDETGNSVTEYVAVRFEGQALLTTYFGEEITNGTLTIPIGNPSTDSDEYTAMAEQANRVAYVLNEEMLPLRYSLTSDNFIKSSINNETVFIFKLVCALAILVVSALLIVRYKSKGLILSIVSIGYIALTLLLIRFANVIVTLNSIYSLIACSILNYIFIVKLLEKLKDISLKSAYLQTLKEYYSLIIPVIVFAVVFTILPTVAISSIGMTLFWGLLTGIIYNTVIIFALKLV